MIAASDQIERDALEKRYQEAFTATTSRITRDDAMQFEQHAAVSQAVIARSYDEVFRLAKDDHQLYASWYQLIEGRVKVPANSKWDIFRVLADHALFPGYKEQIKFAALSTNGIGLSNYGGCSIQLREDMIAHRATVFEENSVIFMIRRNIAIGDADKLPSGYRAAWQDRNKLCFAKLAVKLDPTTRPEDYHELILRPGKDASDDDFVEVHIFGPLTIRSISLVTITSEEVLRSEASIDALNELLNKYQVEIRKIK